MPGNDGSLCHCAGVLQYNNNQYAEMVRLRLQYKSAKDEMNQLQMQLAHIDTHIVPPSQSTVYDRCALLLCFSLELIP